MPDLHLRRFLQRPACPWGLGCMLLCALLLLVPAHAADLELRQGVDVHQLDHHGQHRHDPQHAVSIDAAIHAEDWAPVSGGSSVAGFSGGVHWRRIELHNLDHPESRWLLLVEYPLLDLIDLYVDAGNGSLLEARGGDRRPFAMRASKHRHPNFALYLPPGQSLRLWLRVDSESSIQIPLRLTTERALREHSQTEYLLLGLYFGLLGGLLLYNLVLFATLRDRDHLWYVAYVASFGWLQLCLTGLGFQYLWPGAPFWSNVGLLWAACLAQIALLQFSRRVLQLREHAAGLARVFDGFSLVLLGMLLVAVLLPYTLVIQLTTASVFIMAGLLITGTLLAIRSGHPSARILLLAWMTVLLGVVAYALLAFGLLPKWFPFEYGIQIGSALELVLLSAALAHRINWLTDENRRLARDNMARLEQRVAERTEALDKALSDLSEANRHLRVHAERDGLTGVYNRRLGAEALERLHASSTAQHRPAAALMIDIDGFKAINDQHGHLLGDDCLRELARRLQSGLGAEERLVRWGGEEFLVLLPDCPLAAATERAEGLRASVQAAEHEGLPGLTVSIGVAIAQAAASPAAWLQAADAALYAAKRGGRNRVCVDPASI